jgi:hypothetical protein
MNSRSVIATVVGGVVFFLLGYVFYGLIFADFFAQNVGSATGLAKSPGDMNFIALFLGNLSGAALLTVIFGHWGNIKSFAEGAKAGAIIGLLISLSWDLVMYGTTNAMNLAATLIDPIIGAVMMAIVGGIVAAILGRGAPALEAS